MSHTGKLVVLMLIIVLGAGAAFAQNAGAQGGGAHGSEAQGSPGTKPAWPAYVFSIFLGFGTGQYWVGGNGNLFLVADLSCVGLMAAGAVTAFSASSSMTVGYLMIGASAMAFSAFRIWELIDVFGAVEDSRKEGKVAQMEPVLSVSPTSLGLGVRLPL